jgi:O-antigen/teichoic acid export membrane protein
MMAITLLALLLTQIDKILLSRLLTLEVFGYYALAGTVANALYMLIGPIANGFYPRFTELVARRDEATFLASYHQGAQLATVVMGAAAVVLMVFGDRVLLLWTANPALTRHVAPLLSVLALGTLLNGLMWIPYQMQLAHGWTTLTIKVNSVAVAVLVPGILWAVPKYGAAGAAWMWVALNAGYLIFGIYFMHRRLLPKEKWRWYRQDVAAPLITATATAALCHWWIPAEMGSIVELALLIMVSACVLVAAALTAPMVRHQILGLFRTGSS